MEDLIGVLMQEMQVGTPVLLPAERLYLRHELHTLIPEGKIPVSHPSTMILKCVQECLATPPLSLSRVAALYTTKYPCECQTFYGLERHRKNVEVGLALFGDAVTCDEEEDIMKYFQLHQRYPTRSQLGAFIQDQQRFHANAEEFALRDRVPTPAEGLQHLQEQPAPTKAALEKSDWTCMLCLETIEAPFYELPCRHKFHSNPDDCLGTNILTWLAERKQCPTCKQEVKICPPKCDKTLSNLPQNPTGTRHVKKRKVRDVPTGSSSSSSSSATTSDRVGPRRSARIMEKHRREGKPI